MKFVHIADMHFDSPFTELNNSNLCKTRKLEQRKVFKKVIDYIKENNIEYLFIAGDLYEHEYIRKSTIDYINGLFEEIKNTKIYITPGNHDPYVNGSYYESYEWSSNVYICKSELEIIHEKDAYIYMTAFTDFYMNESPINKINIQNPNKNNILITHCDLNGNRDEKGFCYNPILETKINALKFDLVAMGHIHKTNFKENNSIIYPGSTISFGFDELGEHGMVVGSIENGKLSTEFVRLDDRIFTKSEFLVDNFLDQEQLIEGLNDLQTDINKMYEIILIGNRNFGINCREILKLIDNPNILKIKDKTTLGYDIEAISKENNLRGLFVREIIKKYKTGEYTEQEIEKAIEIGLNAIN